MKNKNSDNLKRRLEQELPYPKLTVQADLKFDEILAALPDKETASQKSESYAGAHYKGKAVPPAGVEVPKGMEYLEPEVKRPNKTKRIVQIFASAAAACFVFIVLLQLTTLQVPKNPPVSKGDSEIGSTASGSDLPMIPVFPENEVGYTATVTSASQQGYYLFMEVQLEFSDAVPDTELLFTGSVLGGSSQNDITVTVDGQEAVLARDPVFARSLEVSNRFEGKVIAVVDTPQSSSAEITIQNLYGVTNPQTHSPFDEPDIKLTDTITCSSVVEIDSEYGLNEGELTVNEITFVDYSVTESRFTVWLKYPVREELLYPTVTAWAYAKDGPIDTLGSFEEMSNGDRRTGMYTQEIGFLPLPEGTTGISIMVEYGSADYGVEYVNGEILRPLPLATFNIDLESGVVKCVEDSPVASYAGLASVYAAGTRYHNHVVTIGWDTPAIDTTLRLAVATDLNFDQPLAAEIYYMGELWETLPLYQTAETIKVGTLTKTIYDIGEVQHLPNGNFGERAYVLSIPLPENDWGTDASIWDEFFDVILRNVVTGEILGSTDGLALASSVQGNIGTIGTHAEILLKPVYGGPVSCFEYGKDNLPYDLPSPLTSSDDSDLSSALDNMMNKASSMLDDQG